MKKAIVISTLVASVIMNTSNVKAEASTEENVGFASGAVAGAAIGGPVGLIIGGIAGVLVGEQVEKANHLDDAQLKINQMKLTETALKQEVDMLQQNQEIAQKNKADAQWVTDGLTLNVMFTTNSAALSDADIKNIERIVDILNQFPSLNIQLDGYTDPRGSTQDNIKLSQKRVDSVIAAFETYGISANRLIGQAHGEMNTFTTEDADGYAMARKVSVHFVSNVEGQLAQN